MRSALGWTLTAVTLVIYLSFILLIGYRPNFLGIPMGHSIMTLGLPIGLFVIVSAFTLGASSECGRRQPDPCHCRGIPLVNHLRVALVGALIACAPVLGLRPSTWRKKIGVSRRPSDQAVKASVMFSFSLTVNSAMPFDLHIASPFVILFEQHGTDEADDRGLIRKDTHDIGASFDFFVQPLDGIGGMDLGPVLDGEVEVSQHVGFAVVDEAGQLGPFCPQLIGDMT
jgi:hypothetical protein